MKFNVGDKVFIRKHTKEEKEMYPFGWAWWKEYFEDGVGTVVDVSASSSGPCYGIEYKNEEGTGLAFFTSDSLSSVDYEQF